MHRVSRLDGRYEERNTFRSTQFLEWDAALAVNKTTAYHFYFVFSIVFSIPNRSGWCRKRRSTHLHFLGSDDGAEAFRERLQRRIVVLQNVPGHRHELMGVGATRAGRRVRARHVMSNPICIPLVRTSSTDQREPRKVSSVLKISLTQKITSSVRGYG